MAQAETDLGAAGAAYLADLETTRAMIEAKLRAALISAAGDPDYLVNVQTVTMTATDDPEAGAGRLTTVVSISTRMPAGIKLTASG